MAEVTYYWAWKATSYWLDSAYMIDGLLTTFAYTAVSGTFERLANTTCPGTDLGTITKVEIRAYGYGDGDDRIDLTPIRGGADGATYKLTMPSSAGWSAYADITDDWKPLVLTWDDIRQLYCDVTFAKSGKGNTMYCAKAEVKVTYTPVSGYPFRRHTLKGTGPYSGRRGFDEVTGHRRGFWPA